MKSLELENYGAVEMNSTELVIVDGGEIVNGYSTESAKSAGKALTEFFSHMYDGIYKQVMNCKC